MVLDDPQTSELALRSPAKRKLSAPAISRSKSNRCCGEPYVLITSSVTFLYPCTWCSSDMTAAISPMSPEGDLVILGLWYTVYPGKFGGGMFFVSFT